MSPTKRDTTELRSSQTTPEPKVLDPRSFLHTKEDIDEYDRHQEDLSIIKHLLIPKELKKSTTEVETNGETTAKEGQNEAKADEEDEEENPLLGQLFLMQFPPLTPNLKITGSTTNSQQPTASEGADTEPAPKTEPQVKREAGDDVEIVESTQPAEQQENDLISAGKPWALPTGRVGKLNVHQSGRVTLDWGGISMELDRGAPVGFVQEAVIVSPNVHKEPEMVSEGAPDRRAWSMGQLSGKFTLTPNWDEML
jgi:DNA-directed RNA polymerase III subunit RPC4